jgi:hypothetical protein
MAPETLLLREMSVVQCRCSDATHSGWSSHRRKTFQFAYCPICRAWRDTATATLKTNCLVKQREIHSLPLSGHPMQGQGWHKKQKYQHDAQLDEKHQYQSSELFFVDFEKMCCPRHRRVPKGVRRDEIEQSKCNADDKRAEEKVPEENDLFVFHDRGTPESYQFISKKPNQ